MRPQPTTLAQELNSVGTMHEHPLANLHPSPTRRIVGLTDTPVPVADRGPSNGGRDAKTARLEAVLFLAKEPLHSRKLSQYAQLTDGTEARTLANRLNQLYDFAGCAFRIHEIAGGMQLRTRHNLANWISRLHHVPRAIKLSPPAMETLAVVAYRQPVLRADIEAVRGVACGELLRQLMERELVRISGRSQDLGRPYFYGTTRLFLQIFGLRCLEDLPRFEDFQTDDQTISTER